MATNREMAEYVGSLKIVESTIWLKYKIKKQSGVIIRTVNAKGENARRIAEKTLIHVDGDNFTDNGIYDLWEKFEIDWFNFFTGGQNG